MDPNQIPREGESREFRAFPKQAADPTEFRRAEFSSPDVDPTQPMTLATSTPPEEHVTDPVGISLDLPSRFHYYPFKNLYIQPLKTKHLAKMAKAHAERSMSILAECISSVLSTTSGEKDLAFKLSLSDFNFVLYWLKLNSTGAGQMEVHSRCTNTQHLRDVAQGKKPETSLNIVTIYTKSDMRITYLDEIPNPELFFVTHPLTGDRIDLRPETVADAAYFTSNDNWTDEEYQYMARNAAVLELKKVFDGRLVDATLDEKIELAGELTPEESELLFKFGELVDNFGVTETITTKCHGCNASGLTNAVVDATSFLPAQYLGRDMV